MNLDKLVDRTLADQVENMQDELNSRWNTLQNCVKKLREVDQSLFQIQQFFLFQPNYFL